jgi:hypothetical protein
MPRDAIVLQRSCRWLLEGEGSDDSDGKFSVVPLLPLSALVFALATCAAAPPVSAAVVLLRHFPGLIDDSMLLSMPTVYSSGRWGAVMVMVDIMQMVQFDLDSSDYNNSVHVGNST